MELCQSGASVVHVVVAGLTDANAKPGSDLLGPARINAPAGRPVSVDIADLSIGSILGKGSFAVVSLLLCSEILVQKWFQNIQTRLAWRKATASLNVTCVACL